MLYPVVSISFVAWQSLFNRHGIIFENPTEKPFEIAIRFVPFDEVEVDLLVKLTANVPPPSIVQSDMAAIAAHL